MLFKEKIVGVDRMLRMGHVYGEVIIEGLEEKEGRKERFKIPFKNENMLAIKEEADDSETVWPFLIFGYGCFN